MGNAKKPLKTMHLFAGGGGGMYADLILGHEPIVAVEWDGYCCEILRARKEDGWWPNCEIIEGDIRAFSGIEYAGKVDCIHAGFPCQDLSVAGKGTGLGGDRSTLYKEALRIFCEVRPRYLFLENVPGIFSHDIGRLFGDLAEIGFDSIRWTCLRASDVGANHRRDRWWCLAHTTSEQDNGIGGDCGQQGPRVDGRREAALKNDRAPNHYGVDGCGQDVAHTESERSREERRDRSEQPTQRTARSGVEVADTEEAKRRRADGPDYRRRGDQETRGQGFTTGGIQYWSVEPDVGRVANGVPQRVNRLKGLGNAQVPLQAAFAWVMLGGPHDAF